MKDLDTAPEDEFGNLWTTTIRGRDKDFHLDVKRNDRGAFLRITEKNVRNRNRDQIIIPIESVDDLIEAIEELDEWLDDGQQAEEQALNESRERENENNG